MSCARTETISFLPMIETFNEEDETISDNHVVGNCFYCGKPVTAGMIRKVRAISYYWTHRNGTPIVATCCWGKCDIETEKDIHKYYLMLCGMTEQEYVERLKIKEPSVYKARVNAGFYNGHPVNDGGLLALP